jgi:signal transduction histidine kinase
MRRRTIIVLAVTLMVVSLTALFSYIYISQFLKQRIATAYDTAVLLSNQLVYAATQSAPDLASTPVDTNNPAAVRAAMAEYLQTDVNLNNLLDSVVGNWPIVYDAAVTDVNGKALLHTNPDLIGKPSPARPDFSILRDSGFRQQLQLVFSPAAVYEVRVPLQLNGEPFGSIRVGVSTVFLKSEIRPRLNHALVLSLASVLLALVVAAGLSHLALGPLETISRHLDSMTAGQSDAVPDASRHDEYGLVTLKIAHLGRKYRDTREIFSALQDDVNKLMGNLQDGLMLFTGDSRAALVSASIERFLGRPHADIVGKKVDEIFQEDSPLGALILAAFRQRRPLVQQVQVNASKHIQVDLKFVQERGNSIAVLTLRDTESARRIEEEIERSRRLSASSRVTRGVAHEVKNPINAIVLHLQLLHNKLQQVEPGTRKHVDIIESEIRRLDRVVQILVDFTRPRDLRLEKADLRRLVEDIILVAQPQAEERRVTITQDLPAESLPIEVDIDLIKQAVLNVVINGIQAMPSGGPLAIAVRRDADAAVVEIRDQGLGIPPEVREKIFELYFTTKEGGSGIGLAQTYQTLQWHHGSVEYETAEGKGTTFRLRLPLAEISADEVRQIAARS